MIDWHHPRIYERLRCFGLCLFALGLASHNADNPPAALAAIIVSMLLVVRLNIELGISRDEEEPGVGRKLHRIQQINTVAIAPIVFGVLVVLRRLDIGEGFNAPFRN